MSLRQVQFEMRRMVARFGTVGAIRHVVRRALRRPGGPIILRSYSEFFKECTPVHPFDERLGVDTSGLILPHDLSGCGRNDVFGSGYIGVPPSLFHQALERLEIDHSRFTFVDLGSGKGRALLLASQHPFHEIVGVELSDELHAIASANLLRRRTDVQGCQNVRSIRGDATEFQFPPGPMVVYMWRPFDEPVLKQVLANLQQSLRQEPREVYVLYLGVEVEPCFENIAELRKLWSSEFVIEGEEYDAFPVIERSEGCLIYVSAGAARGLVGV